MYIEEIEPNGIYEFRGMKHAIEFGEHVVAIGFIAIDNTEFVLAMAYSAIRDMEEFVVINPAYLIPGREECKCDLCWSVKQGDFINHCHDILDERAIAYHHTLEDMRCLATQ